MDQMCILYMCTIYVYSIRMCVYIYVIVNLIFIVYIYIYRIVYSIHTIYIYSIYIISLVYIYNKYYIYKEYMMSHTYTYNIVYDYPQLPCSFQAEASSDVEIILGPTQPLGAGNDHSCRGVRFNTPAVVTQSQSILVPIKHL